MKFLKLLMYSASFLVAASVCYITAYANSPSLSVHRASLECTLDNVSKTAPSSVKSSMGKKDYTQLRYDWIRDELLRYRVALDSNEDFYVWKMKQEADRYYSWEYSANSDVLYEVSRETLEQKVTFYNKDKTEKFWWTYGCVKIDPEIIDAAMKAQIKALKSKQQI